MVKIKPVFFALICCALSCCSRSQSHLRKAEEFSRRKEFDRAIAEYQEHMHYRLNLQSRPEWEDPYFYLILIGDLKLLEAKPNEALETYRDADQHGVDVNLVSDRYRSLAHWYEQQGNLDSAVAVLKERREKDPLLFDAMLDRLSKEIVAREELQKETQKKF